MTHYLWINWMCVKLSGPEDVIDEAIRHSDPFEDMVQIIEHFEDYEEIEIKRLT